MFCLSIKCKTKCLNVCFGCPVNSGLRHGVALHLIFWDGRVMPRHDPFNIDKKNFYLLFSNIR
jgi:hypothetical protein